MSLSQSLKWKKGNVAKKIRFFMGFGDDVDNGEKTVGGEKVEAEREKCVKVDESEQDNEVSGSIKEGIDQLKLDLLESDKVLIVMAFGPSRSGKSTLLNFLTVKNYPCLEGSGFLTSKIINKSIFEVGGGEESCTRDFLYHKIKASSFRSIHGLDPEPDNEFDILFVDSEGFGNSGDGASKNLFLGLFTLMGISNVQLFLSREVMLNDNRIKCIAQNIVSTRLLGNGQPKLISIARGDPKEKRTEPQIEVNEDSGDESDKDEYQEYLALKKKCIEDNKELYDDFNGRDKKNKSTFVTKLQEKAIIEDANKIEILTMPHCIQYNKEAYKRTLKDLSRMILNGATPRKGSELCEIFEKTREQVYEKCGLIKGQVSMDSVYSKIMNDMLESIKTLEKEVLNCFKTSVAEMKLEEIQELLSKGPKNPKISTFVSHPFTKLVDVIKRYVPETGLDDITKTLLGKIKIESVDRMKKDLKNVLNLEKVWRDNNSMIHKLYQVNQNLQDAKEGQIVPINLIDKDGNITKKRVNVRVLKDSFEYQNINEKKEEKNHYIFPVGIKISRKTTQEATKKFFWKERDTDSTTESNDITECYHFDFISMRAFPIAKDKYRKCSFEFLDYEGIFKYLNVISVEKKVTKTSVVISLDDKCDFLIKNCEVIDYDNVKLGDRKTDDNVLRWPNKSKKELVVEAKSHETHKRVNETKITFINFEPKRVQNPCPAIIKI